MAVLVVLAAGACSTGDGAAMRSLDALDVIEAHLAAAFVSPEPRFAARTIGSSWRFDREGAHATWSGDRLAVRWGDVAVSVGVVEIARGAARVALDPVALVAVEGARIHARRGAADELFVHGAPGIEHAIAVHEVPEGEGALEVIVALDGASALDVHDRGARVRDGAGRESLVYEGLRAWDARGVELVARMEREDRGVRLLIDDAGATLPIVIDPVIAAPRGVLTASDAMPEDELGRSVAIDGDVMVVGAPYRMGRGAAYVFERDAAGAWLQRTILTPPLLSAEDEAGRAVAISGDTIVIASPNDDHPMYEYAGAVDVFRRNGAGTWAHEQRIVNPAPTTYGERFGSSVAIVGDLLVVGAYNDQSFFTGGGGAYTYVRTGTTWAPEATLQWDTASSNDSFGTSVATDGTRIVVGAPYDDGFTRDDEGYLRENVGAAFVFVRSGPATWVQEARLASDPERTWEHVGQSVAIDGDRVIVGAPGADDDEGTIASRGVAYVFALSGGAWRAEARLLPVPATDWTTYAELGTSVALEGTIAVVGAPGLTRPSLGRSPGFVYAYTRAGTTWSAIADLTGVVRTESFGQSVALDGTTLAIGAPEEDASATAVDQGAVYVYELVEPRADGEACTAGSQCTSTFCVDGVCCNNLCGGGPSDCQACSVAAGAATDGVCAAVASGRTCRAAVGGCDAAETCDGTSSVCPSDARASAGTVCRAAVGVCDVEERCSGTSTTCPLDLHADDGTSCDDGASCNGADACASGVCAPVAPTDECDDEDACTADACADDGGCTHTPIEGCCASDAACDDGDVCTADACAASRCEHVAIAGCGVDAGTDEDAGAPESDAGAAVDAGAGGTVEAGSDGGCACAMPGRGKGPTPVASALVFVALATWLARRTRCRS
ncbi:Integrin alpha beta-propellor repeat protein [Sandaracinus amylolyticus]|uniref:Integrin alpha beta-propellor repeat protein n=2 Tax=Sandaracinus amylolyticus TaxID=927083 RepID=A0A0F6SFZ8_9BACT|nr:Integrin alpha beta-propellor repeat protein [Sandaracinus amylolyticus]